MGPAVLLEPQKQRSYLPLSVVPMETLPPPPSRGTWSVYRLEEMVPVSIPEYVGQLSTMRIVVQCPKYRALLKPAAEPGCGSAVEHLSTTTACYRDKPCPVSRNGLSRVYNQNESGSSYEGSVDGHLLMRLAFIGSLSLH